MALEAAAACSLFCTCGFTRRITSYNVCYTKLLRVLVNEHAKTTADLLAFKAKIVESVQQKFGIELVQEPELLP